MPMPSRPTARQWIRAVQSCQTIRDADRVLAFELFLEMTDNRRVSVPRHVLARRVARSERKVQERIAGLHSAGLLSTVSRGQKGKTAVYEGLIPTALRVTDSSTLNRTGFRHPETPFSVTPGGPTSTTADPTPGGADRNVGSEKKRRGRMPFDLGHEWAEDDSRWTA